MTAALAKMRSRNAYDCDLIDDLLLIVANLKEEKFVEAILNLQTLQPQAPRRPPRPHPLNLPPLPANASIASNPPCILRGSQCGKVETGSLASSRDTHRSSLLEEALELVGEDSPVIR